MWCLQSMLCCRVGDPFKDVHRRAFDPRFHQDARDDDTSHDSNLFVTIFPCGGEVSMVLVHDEEYKVYAVAAEVDMEVAQATANERWRLQTTT